MKLSGFKYLTNQGVENIWKNKMMAFATFCVLLISLLLVGIAGLFYLNLNSMILGLGNLPVIIRQFPPQIGQGGIQIHPGEDSRCGQGHDKQRYQQSQYFAFFHKPALSCSVSIHSQPFSIGM